MESNEDMFVGRIELQLDSLGRFQIPPEWFDKVGQGKYVYVLADPKERCLRMASVRNMEARLAKMRERAVIEPAMNRALQIIGENAEQIEVDNEGVYWHLRKVACVCWNHAPTRDGRRRVLRAAVESGRIKPQGGKMSKKVLGTVMA